MTSPIGREHKSSLCRQRAVYVAADRPTITRWVSVHPIICFDSHLDIDLFLLAAYASFIVELILGLVDRETLRAPALCEERLWLDSTSTFMTIW
jgi:hypothetical protein